MTMTSDTKRVKTEDDITNEVLRRFECGRTARPFTRCPRCNAPLQPVDKARVVERVPPRTRECQDLFSECTGCASVYWPGSHYERIQRFLQVAFSAANRPTDGAHP